MRLVQWLARGFHEGRLVEPGEQMLVDDSVQLGPHMMDVATGLTGDAALPKRVETAYRADLAEVPPPAHGHPVPTTEAEARTFGDRVGGVAGAVINHLWAEIDWLRDRLKAATDPLPSPVADAEAGAETPLPVEQAAEQAAGAESPAEG